jgi:hypothetical protein
MNKGNRAEISRSFDVNDLEEYAELSGHAIHKDRVPEPLIGALFSYLLGVKVPGEGTMYLKQETRYCEEALPGETLAASVEITRLRPEKCLADLATICRGHDGRIIAEGRALVYVGDVVEQSGGDD